MKNEVLRLLKESEGKPLSGQYLAESMRVSRTAVWKAVNALRRDGYEISSRTNAGYALVGGDVLNADSVRKELNSPDSLQIITYSSVDSTNTEAKRLLTAGLSKPTLIIAEEQTQGRGRQGKSFFSGEGGLFASFVLFPKRSDVTLVTCQTAVCVCEAIEKLTGLEPKIKWVNDIFLNGKKICGILTEAISDFESGELQGLIIGIGINTNVRTFPTELGDVAATLPLHTGRCKLVAEIANGLLRGLTTKNTIFEYKKRSLLLGKTVHFVRDGKSYEGRATDIDENGRLEVDCGEKIVLNSGEVSVASA